MSYEPSFLRDVEEHLLRGRRVPTGAGVEMSAPKFTPGPWRIEEVRSTFEDAARIVDADGETVTHVIADDTMEIDDGAIAEVLSPKAKANARLIAAAPDLYAALKAYQDANRIHNDAESDLYDAGKAALKKAVSE